MSAFPPQKSSFGTRWRAICPLILVLGLVVGAPFNLQNAGAAPGEQEAKQGATYTNPLGIPAADPSITRVGDTYYLYATSIPGRGFQAWSSKDLVHWKEEGTVFEKDEDSWGQEHFWAPEVLEHDDAFYLFYSAAGQAIPGRWRQDLRICVAKSDSPTGPFEDLAAPLFEPGWAAIDAFPFIDVDGQPYLYFARDISQNPTSDIYVVRLKDDMTGVEGEPQLLLSPLGEQAQAWEGGEWNEGPGVLTYEKKDGELVYIMFYSAGGFFRPEYAVGYATAPSPTGPWTKGENNPILAKKDTPGGFVSGPGHGDFVYSPDGTELFYIYHVHIHPEGGHERELAMDRVFIEEDEDGNVRVRMHGPTKGEPQPVPSRNAPDKETDQ